MNSVFIVYQWADAHDIKAIFDTEKKAKDFVEWQNINENKYGFDIIQHGVK